MLPVRCFHRQAVPAYKENAESPQITETSKFPPQEGTARQEDITQAKLAPLSPAVSVVSMYTSSLVSRLSIGFVARGAFFE